MNHLSKGLWPVMLTPFNADLSLDLPCLETLTQFYLDTGAHGLFANCLSSEMYHLTPDERLQTVRTIINKANGQIPVIATGSFGTPLAPNLDFIKRLYDLGVQSVVINTNQFDNAGSTNERFIATLEKIIEGTPGIPLGLYECPTPYKKLLDHNTLKWLSQSQRFNYLKETSCDPDELILKIEATKDTPLGVYNAHTPTAWLGLKAGAKGISSIAANWYPELMAFFVAHYDNPNKELTIEALHDKLSIMDSLIHQFYPLSAKIFLQKRGLPIKPYARVSSWRPTQSDHLVFEALWRQVQDISQSLAINLY